MNKHTPGPWRSVGSHGMLRHCILGPRGEIIARYSAWEDHPEEAEANTSLMVAAPDLLAACEAVVNAYEENDWSAPGVSDGLYDAIEGIRAAIAKVRGEDPPPIPLGLGHLV